MEVVIKHKILKKLRESRTIPLDAMATNVGLSIADYKEYEKNDKKVGIQLAERFAGVFKRNWSVFLLEELEGPNLYKHDNRTLENRTPSLHLKTIEAIEDASYIFEFAKELSTFKGLKIPKYENVKNLTPEELAGILRKESKITIEKQIKFPNSSQAFRAWKLFIESLGIFVSQYPLSPEDKIRAFSITDSNRAIIVLNTKDTQKARIFSLFHELCHVLRRSSGICDLHNSSSSNVEAFCNNFAANFLAPEDVVNEYIDRQGDESVLSDLDHHVSRLASKLKVSELVIYRRLATLRLISDSDYSKIHKEILSNFPAPSPRIVPDKEEKVGGPDYYVVKNARNGKAYTNVVVEAFNTGEISAFEASNALSINPRILNDYIRKTAHDTQ